MKRLIRRLFATAIFAASTQSIACPQLSSVMDEVYGPGQWTQRTTEHSGTDIAPAIKRAISGFGEVCIDRGAWSLKTPLSADQLSGAVVRGVSSQASRVFYQRPDGAAFSFSGAGGRTGGGLHGLAILLEDGYGPSSAVAVHLAGDSQFQPDQMMFSDLYITAVGSSYWWAGFYVHGNARTAPKGIRVGSVNNVQVFRAHGLGFWLSNIVQWSLTNIGVYAGAGGGNNLYLAGGGTAVTNSELVTISAAAISGQLNITNTTRFDVSASCQSIGTMPNAAIGRVLALSCPVIGVFGPGVSVLSGGN